MGNNNNLAANAACAGEFAEIGDLAFSPHVVALIADNDGTVVYANEACCRLLGYAKEELLGKNAGFLKSGEQPERAFAEMRAALGSNLTWQEEIPFAGKAGRLWLEATLAPVADAQGKVHQYVLLLADITAVKNAKLLLRDANLSLERQVAGRTAALLAELLKTREQQGKVPAPHPVREHWQLQYESILNSAGEGIYGLDVNGRCSFINPAAARMLGWEPQELIGKPFHDLMHHTRQNGSPYPASECPTRVAMREGSVSQVDDEVFWRKDGTCFDVAYTTTPIREGERNVGAVVVFSDTSERKQVERALQQSLDELKALNGRLQDAQNQLLQSEKMASIGQLAAGVAHEINNPIGFVNSNIGTLGQYLQDIFTLLEAYERVEASLAPGERENIRSLREKLDVVFLKQDVPALLRESEEGISRVKKIVQNLKDFSHVDEAEWQWVDLHKGLESTLNVVWNELKYKTEVVKEYGVLPEVECLPSQLNQVFMNLLVNAAHAIEEHGVITLRTGTEGEEVWVEVADTGKGISPENLPRIFEPFFTTKPVGKGTGLGLSLSYGIVQKHHGRIEVESEVGKGTTFRVTLPVRQAEAKAAQ